MRHLILTSVLGAFSISSHASFENAEVIEILAPKSTQVTEAQHSTVYLEDEFSLDFGRTIADAMRRVNGVNLNGQGGQFQSYSIRGFSRGRIRTEIDGIPIITDRRAGNSVSFVSPDLINRLQVIKGPISSLYGTQALGGVVNLTTEWHSGTSFKLASQLDGRNQNVSVKHQRDNYDFAIAHQRSANERAANGRTLFTEYSRTSSIMRYRSRLKGIATTFSWLPSYGSDIGKSSERFPAREISDYPEDIHSLAQLHLAADSGWTAKVFHHYQNWDNATERQDQFNALNQYQSHTIGASWLDNMAFLGEQGVVGVDWLSRRGVKIISEYQLIAPTDNTELPNAFNNSVLGSEDTFALYAKSSKQVADIEIDLGLRYDRLVQRNANQPTVNDDYLSGSVSAYLDVSPTLGLGYSVANGFRYPTLSERYFDGRTPRGFVTGNAVLLPEESLGHQVTLDWRVSSALNVNIQAYHYDLDNYIQRYEITQDQLSYRNLDTARIHGFEISAHWRVSNRQRHQFAYQQQLGRDNQDQPLDDLIPRRIHWTFHYDFDKLSLSNTVSHTFRTDEVGPSELERGSNTLWNASMTYLLSDNHTISFTVNNILNQTYYASLDEDAPLQPERSLRLATEWSF